jgi:hypothetical protein
MTALSVALFVEGSHATPPARGLPPLESIWGHLRDALGLVSFSRIIPISKKHLVAMDPDQPRMSGAGEALDQLMARVLEQHPFQAAVVAWDLVPAWNPEGEFCRWDETLRLYRFLAQSARLPALWQHKARTRHVELSQRAHPGARTAPPALEEGAVLTVCMEPMFESLLVQKESAVRRALGVGNQPIRGWPRQGWGDASVTRPDADVLAPAINALLAVRPRLDAVKRVRGNMRTRKNEWGELLLRRLLDDHEGRASIMQHPLSRRLVELLPAGPAARA